MNDFPPIFEVFGSPPASPLHTNDNTFDVESMYDDEIVNSDYKYDGIPLNLSTSFDFCTQPFGLNVPQTTAITTSDAKTKDNNVLPLSCDSLEQLADCAVSILKDLTSQQQQQPNIVIPDDSSALLSNVVNCNNQHSDDVSTSKDEKMIIDSKKETVDIAATAVATNSVIDANVQIRQHKPNTKKRQKTYARRISDKYGLIGMHYTITTKGDKFEYETQRMFYKKNCLECGEFYSFEIPIPKSQNKKEVIWRLDKTVFERGNLSKRFQLYMDIKDIVDVPDAVLEFVQRSKDSYGDDTTKFYLPTTVYKRHQQVALFGDNCHKIIMTDLAKNSGSVKHAKFLTDSLFGYARPFVKKHELSTFDFVLFTMHSIVTNTQFAYFYKSDKIVPGIRQQYYFETKEGEGCVIKHMPFPKDGEIPILKFSSIDKNKNVIFINDVGAVAAVSINTNTAATDNIGTAVVTNTNTVATNDVGTAVVTNTNTVATNNVGTAVVANTIVIDDTDTNTEYTSVTSDNTDINTEDINDATTYDNVSDTTDIESDDDNNKFEKRERDEVDDNNIPVAKMPHLIQQLDTDTNFYSDVNVCIDNIVLNSDEESLLFENFPSKKRIRGYYKMIV